MLQKPEIEILDPNKDKGTENTASEQNQVNNPTPRKFFSLFIKIVLVVIGVIVLLIASMLGYFVITNRLDAKRQLNEFNLAAQNCGKEPVVVVHSYVQFGEVNEDYDAYAPINPYYNEVKAVAQKDIFGYKKVVLYACSLGEAKTKFENLHINNGLRILDDNYTQAEKQVLTKKLIEDLKAKGIKLYTPKAAPVSFYLKERKYDSLNKIYSYGYLKQGTNAGNPILDGVYFGCEPKSDLTPLGSNYRPDESVGTNQLGGVIYFVRDFPGDQRFTTLLGSTWCQLINSNGLIDQSEAVELLSGLQEQALDELQNFELGGYSSL